MRYHKPAFTFLAAVILLTGVTAQAEPAKRERRKTTSRPITNPKFDASADRIELFAGIEDGSLETKVILTGPEHGNVLVTNTTDQPLTVELPESVVAVHVLKQFGGAGGFGGGGQGGFGGGQGGLGGQGGGQQNTGGGLGGGGQGGFGGGAGGFGGGGQQGGGGFFSIPPEKTVKVPYHSVCLNHGKPDPTPRSNYVLVPTEEYTQDPVLKELLVMVGTGRIASHAAQAAVWNRTDDLTWQQLASKATYGPLGNRLPYFNRGDLQQAQILTATAQGRARERGETKAEPNAETAPARGR